MIQSFGKVTVSSAGTPVLASTNAPYPGPYTTANSLMIEAWPSNAGKIYIGVKANMNKSTGDGVIAILATPTSNSIPTFSVTVPYAPAAVDASQIWIDADNSGDAVIVSSAAS